jgi:hypothetical protein
VGMSARACIASCEAKKYNVMGIKFRAEKNFRMEKILVRRKTRTKKIKRQLCINATLPFLN